MDEINAKSKELEENGILEDKPTREDPRQGMSLDLGDLSDQSDTGVFPTPSSLLTTPGTPGEVLFRREDRKDSGVITSPESPAPAALGDTPSAWDKASDSSVPSTETKPVVSSPCLPIRVFYCRTEQYAW